MEDDFKKKWKKPSFFFEKMEDDLKDIKNGRQLKKIKQMEDDLKKKKLRQLHFFLNMHCILCIV
jgi:hypothetical protein